MKINELEVCVGLKILAPILWLLNDCALAGGNFLQIGVGLLAGMCGAPSA